MSVIAGTDGPHIEVYSTGHARYRLIPAFEYNLTWDHTEMTCYYVGNRQGGPERSHNPTESVIEGSQSQYETSSLFATSFAYSMFDTAICSGGPV